MKGLRALIVFVLGFAAIAAVPVFATGTGEKTAPATGNFNPTGYPIAKQPITLKILFFSQQITKNLDELPMFADLEKKTGIHIEWDQLRSGWDEKKSVILASGDLPDAFMGDGIKDADIASNTAYFVPLEDSISRYAPNIQKMFTEEPTLKRLSSFPPEGHIYGLPNKMPFRPDSVDVLMINKAWLDKLGMKMPTTLDEFHAVLTAFKTRDPNGNGKADEVPFHFSTFFPSVWSWDTFSARALIGAYSIMFDGKESLVVNNDKVTYLPARSEYRQLVNYLNQLYSEGLINPEIFTQDFTKWLSISKNPDVPVVGVTLGWAISTMVGDKWESQYVAMPPLKASGVSKPLWTMNRPLLQYNLNRFAITTKDKYLPETVRWVDALYAPEMSAQLFFGSNGVGVQPSADGKWKILPPADQNVDPDTWKWMNSTGDFGPYFFSKDLQSRLIPTDFYKGRLDLDSVYKSYFPADRDIYPLVKFSKPDLDRLTILKTDIQKFVAQKYAEWVTKGVIDSQWDDYKSQLNKMGLEELLSIYQKNYDAFYK